MSASDVHRPKLTRAPRPGMIAPLPERPTCPIPIDREHEFFKPKLPTYDSPIVRTWIDHFNRTHVAFERIDLDGRTQLYLHRVKLHHSHTTIEQWCCTREQRRMA